MDLNRMVEAAQRVSEAKQAMAEAKEWEASAIDNLGNARMELSACASRLYEAERLLESVVREEYDPASSEEQ